MAQNVREKGFEWLLCPTCGSKTRIKMRADTGITTRNFWRVVNQKSPEVQAFLAPQFQTATQNTELMVLREQDRVKFKHAADPELVFQMLMLMGEGMAVRYGGEQAVDYQGMMELFQEILTMLKNNFYKEEYLK